MTNVCYISFPPTTHMIPAIKILLNLKKFFQRMKHNTQDFFHFVIHIPILSFPDSYSVIQVVYQTDPPGSVLAQPIQQSGFEKCPETTHAFKLMIVDNQQVTPIYNISKISVNS